jgi:FtsP/CotA-like multicopper oxidase with cupredoxin domain
VRRLTRRKLLAGGLATAPAAALLHDAVPHKGVHAAIGGGTQTAAAAAPQAHHDGGHGGGVSGATFRKGETVDHKANGFNPTDVLRDFDYGKTRRLASGRVLREWDVYAVDKEVEIAPGIKYPAWTFNNRIPGPTLRAHEGELLRVKFANGSAHPHTMHFHGIHPAGMDGVPDIGRGIIQPGEIFTYEFDAKPFGVHLYHCHVGPLAEHIARGMYGTFIVDPKAGRPDADEMVMVQHGYNTTFDGEGNQFYAVNGIPFHYMAEPIEVRRGEPVRIYLVNTLEYDPINSFHVHGNFFDYYPTGTRLEPTEFTDTVIQGQAQRGICELRFPHAGPFMFHAHKTEFAELGWMGFFEVEE